MCVIIYDVKYVNAQRMITDNLNDVILLVRDTRMGAYVYVWLDGNCIAEFDVRSTVKEGSGK